MQGVKMRFTALRWRKVASRRRKDALPRRPRVDEVARRHGLRELTPGELKELHARILPPDGEG